MTRAKKSCRIELTKEQQALILQNTGMEAKELELTDNALRVQTSPSMSAASRARIPKAILSGLPGARRK
jgi:hypothetical protein